jgi:hypothetical protein
MAIRNFFGFQTFIVEEGEEEGDICSCFGIIYYLFSFSS